ncbi:MAG: autotransporter outer membrane beta-barrel domain-containing protein [Rhodospirillaceae bacterium]
MNIRHIFLVKLVICILGLLPLGSARAGTYGTDPTTPTAAQEEARKESTASTQTSRAATQQTVSIIGSRITAILSPSRMAPSGGSGGGATPSGSSKKSTSVLPGATQSTAGAALVTSGYSAGDETLSRAAWVSYNHSWVRSDWDEIKSSSTIHTGVFGADMKLDDRFLVGLSGVVLSTGSNNSFNDGFADGKGYAIVPYGALSLLDGTVVIEAMTGFGQGSSDVRRNVSVFPISYKSDSDRWLASTAVTYNHALDKLSLSAKLGWMMAYEWTHGYTDSLGNAVGSQISRLGEASIGGRAAYTFDGLEPYFGVTVVYDPLLTPDGVGLSGNRLDRKEVTGTLGFNWMPDDGIIAGMEASNGFFRERQGNTTVSASLRIAF